MANRRKKTYVGKIAFCDNSDLGFVDAQGVPFKGGHYVYVRKVNGNKCDVNIITSLEDKNAVINSQRIDKVRKGYLYPIPKSDANFNQWSAVNLDGNIKSVNLSALKSVGQKKIKHRHKWFVGKFTKNHP